jgi:FixJ family two-component response regulator
MVSMATPLISVVDDDDSVRESLAGLLRSVGLAVKVFASAEELLASDTPDRTDCLILDVRMPGMNGLELQRHLKSTHPLLPVVFITAHGSEDEIRLRAMDAGAVDYLLKPLSEEEVLAAVQSALKTA